VCKVECSDRHREAVRRGSADAGLDFVVRRGEAVGSDKLVCCIARGPAVATDVCCCCCLLACLLACLLNLSCLDACYDACNGTRSVLS
jgi:hypothetical protein